MELIGDFVHLSPLLLQAVLASRDTPTGSDVAFITDAIAEAVPGRTLAYGGTPGQPREARVNVDGSAVTCCDLYVAQLDRWETEEAGRL